MSKILLGADPEFTIFDTENMPIPAHIYFPRKDKKKTVREVTGDHLSEANDEVAAIYDGVNLELNFVRPHATPGDLIYLLYRNLQRLHYWLPGNMRIYARSAFKIPLVRLQDCPGDVQQFGCEPSMCAYRNAKKYVDLDGIIHPLRYAGGHMHISGGAASNPENHPTLAKLCDRYIAYPLNYILFRPELFWRRKHYGQAGEYRTQTYPDGTIGFEYRTPPAEMWNHWNLPMLFFQTLIWIVEEFDSLRHLTELKDQTAIRNTIDTGRGPLTAFLNETPFYTRPLLDQFAADRTLKDIDFARNLPPTSRRNQQPAIVM